MINKREPLMPPVHPGEILREDFMKPLGLTANRLALDLHVPATRLGEIVHARRRITVETALRLARYFHTNPEFWLNLQSFYDLEVSRRSGAVREIERQVHPVVGAIPIPPEPRRKRQPGSMKGKLPVGAEFFDPLPDSEQFG